jgi:hypothetical protein
MTPGRIATELLDRISAPELLPNELEKHFKPFLEKYKLDSNEILIEYCMHLMNYSGKPFFLKKIEINFYRTKRQRCFLSLDSSFSSPYSFRRRRRSETRAYFGIYASSPYPLV